MGNNEFLNFTGVLKPKDVEAFRLSLLERIAETKNLVKKYELSNYIKTELYNMAIKYPSERKKLDDMRKELLSVLGVDEFL